MPSSLVFNSAESSQCSSSVIIYTSRYLLARLYIITETAPHPKLMSWLSVEEYEMIIDDVTTQWVVRSGILRICVGFPYTINRINSFESLLMAVRYLLNYLSSFFNSYYSIRGVYGVHLFVLSILFNMKPDYTSSSIKVLKMCSHWDVNTHTHTISALYLICLNVWHIITAPPTHTYTKLLLYMWFV